MAMYLQLVNRNNRDVAMRFIESYSTVPSPPPAQQHANCISMSGRASLSMFVVTSPVLWSLWCDGHKKVMTAVAATLGPTDYHPSFFNVLMALIEGFSRVNYLVAPQHLKFRFGLSICQRR